MNAWAFSIAYLYRLRDIALSIPFDVRTQRNAKQILVLHVELRMNAR